MKKWLVICVVVMLLLATSVPAFAQAEALDSTPRLAIVSAFGPEIVLMLQEAEVADTYTVNGVTFTTGTLMGNDVVLFLSGVSTVNTAMTIQSAIDHFNITHIIFSGIAGGVDPSLRIGDVVVPQQWGQYLEMEYARETAPDEFSNTGMFEYNFDNFGMMFPRPVTVYSDSMPEGESKFWFEVDPAMFAVAQSIEATLEADLLQCNADEVCLTEAPDLIVGGNGVSGPVFVDNAEFREYAFATFEAAVLDMETASAAMVAYSNNIPFIGFRSLSDLAGGGEGANEMGTFFSIAADNAALVVMDFLSAWAEQG